MGISSSSQVPVDPFQTEEKTSCQWKQEFYQAVWGSHYISLMMFSRLNQSSSFTATEVMQITTAIRIFPGTSVLGNQEQSNKVLKCCDVLWDSVSFWGRAVIMLSSLWNETPVGFLSFSLSRSGTRTRPQEQRVQDRCPAFPRLPLAEFSLQKVNKTQQANWCDNPTQDQIKQKMCNAKHLH